MANAGFGEDFGTIRNSCDLHQIKLQGRSVPAGNAATFPHNSGILYNAVVTCQLSIWSIWDGVFSYVRDNKKTRDGKNRREIIFSE
jgi:hypothetical protein